MMALTRLSNLRQDRVERAGQQVTFVALLCVSVSAGTVKLFVCCITKGVASTVVSALIITVISVMVPVTGLQISFTIP